MSKKSESLFAPQVEQIVLKLDETPNVFPLKINKNIITDINGPDIYQGQGFNMFSIII
jgi:hypothetical protein